MERVVSAFGALVLLGIAYALCPGDRRRHVRWRTIATGSAVLLVFALVVLKTPARAAFVWADARVKDLLDFSHEGAKFLFGKLVTETSFGYVFAFQVLPTIIFFAALMSVLYYVRLMPFVVRQCGRALARWLGTSGAESFSTVADVFVGQTEAPLVIRPYLAGLTLSELHACMVAGFATTAGGVLLAYVGMLSPYVPEIGGHLIACSVMCAPASLVVAKLLLPETGKPQTSGESRIDVPPSGTNVLDAIAAGTSDGVRLAVNVGAMLVAFVALAALANSVIGWASGLVLAEPLSLEKILGWAFAPIAWLMGVPSADVTKVGSLLGQKTVFTEFIAYSNMSDQLSRDPSWLSERGRLIASYALCGFANFASIGIQIGGYSGLAPERRSDLSRLALRAMVGGSLTTCLVAAVAGALA
ncbi:MAG TPA: nucleoside transporter C-terminal domain-containing protein [Planctomycetota bacterium]|nr:nucleoside transporter C-terminal domain-containing protein [Planctomycetota bacterium]